MKSASRFAAVAAVAAVALAPAAAPAAPIRDPQPVVVTNDTTNPVVATLTGAPTVTAQGTVGIDPARNVVQVSNLPATPPAPVPYQARVDVLDTGDTFFHCADIPVPSGRTLKITHVSIEARAPSTSSADALEAALRNGAAGQTPLALTHPIPLSGSGLLRRGQLETVFYVGPLSEPSAATWKGDLCLLNIEPQGLTSFEALITGELL